MILLKKFFWSFIFLQNEYIIINYKVYKIRINRFFKKKQRSKILIYLIKGDAEVGKKQGI